MSSYNGQLFPFVDWGLLHDVYGGVGDINDQVHVARQQPHAACPAALSFMVTPQ